jgi:hypothetical protein
VSPLWQYKTLKIFIMTTYKEVFQLAQDKGYLPCDRFLNENGFRMPEFETDEVKLIELTLIQKWLRDEHKIYFEIDTTRIKQDVIVHRVAASRLIAGMVRRITTYKYTSYEQALLEGINEALKLI